MKKANIFVNTMHAGVLEKLSDGFNFTYIQNYEGTAVSLTIPIGKDPIYFKNFPSFFEGLLPEGMRLEILIKENKIDKNDYFKQLLVVGQDLVGNVTAQGVLDE